MAQVEHLALRSFLSTFFRTLIDREIEEFRAIYDDFNNSAAAINPKLITVL